MSGTIFDLLTSDLEEDEDEDEIGFVTNLSPLPTSPPPDSPPPSSIKPKKSSKDEEVNFFNLALSEEGMDTQPESGGLRPKARVAKGFTSGLLGSYGDILDIVRAQPKEQLLPGQKELIKAEFEAPEHLKPFFSEDDLIPSHSRISSSEEVKDFLKSLGAPGEPSTTEEKLLERGPEFLGSLLSFGGIAPGKNAITKLGKTIFRGLTPGAVSVGAEQADLPPWAQAASTIAASIFAHRATGKSLKQINSETYEKAYSLLPKGAKTSSSNLERTVNLLKKGLLKGGEAPSEKAVLNFLGKVSSKISGGTIKIDELTALKRSLNEIISLDEVRRAPARARTLLRQISKTMDGLIEKYGKSNPDFLKNYKSANSAFKGINEATYIERFIKKNPLTAAHGGVVLKYLLPSLTSSTAIAGGTLIKATEVAAALARNPGLRKIYLKFLQNASKDLIKPSAEGLKKLNKGLREELPDLDL